MDLIIEILEVGKTASTTNWNPDDDTVGASPADCCAGVLLLALA